MRGLQHNVIEINDTENTDIEKILIFLRSDGRKITVDNTRRDVSELLKKVKVEKPRRKIPREIKLLAGILLLTLGALAVMMMLM